MKPNEASEVEGARRAILVAATRWPRPPCTRWVSSLVDHSALCSDDLGVDNACRPDPGVDGTSGKQPARRPSSRVRSRHEMSQRSWAFSGRHPLGRGLKSSAQQEALLPRRSRQPAAWVMGFVCALAHAMNSSMFRKGTSTFEAGRRGMSTEDERSAERSRTGQLEVRAIFLVGLPVHPWSAPS